MTLGFVAVGALLAAAIFLALLDHKEKRRGGNARRSQFLSQMALGLFLAAFVGGVVVTLLSGVGERQDDGPMTGVPMGAPTETAGAMGMGQIDSKAFEQLQKKVAADPKDVTARERLGHLYLQQQDFENVFKMAHEALQIDPKSTESRVHMGMVLFSMQQTEKAVLQFNQVLATDPNNLEALRYKGLVQFQGQQDLEGAKETLTRYMKIAQPDDTGYKMAQMFLGMIASQRQGGK